MFSLLMLPSKQYTLSDITTPSFDGGAVYDGSGGAVIAADVGRL